VSWYGNLINAVDWLGHDEDGPASSHGARAQEFLAFVRLGGSPLNWPRTPSPAPLAQDGDKPCTKT